MESHVSAQLLWWVLWAMVFAAAVLLAIVVGSRCGRTWRVRREQAVLTPLRPALLEVASGEDDDSSALARLTAVAPRHVALVDRTVSVLLSKVRGDPARALAQVLRTHGRAQWARRGLTSASAVRRAHSAWTLGLMREIDAGPQITPLLQDRSADVVVTAARALTLIGDGGAARAVVRAVAPRRRPQGLPSWAAVESLCAFGEPVGSVVVEALQHPHPAVRHVAATVVDARPVPQAGPAVRARLPEEQDARTLTAMLGALGRVGSVDDLPLLCRFTEHEDEQVGLAAVGALERLGSSAAVEALCPLLADPRPRVAERAATALAELGPGGRTHLQAAAALDGPAAGPSRYALQMAGLRGGR
ncbi:HEAT repeat domain-containing protein [Kocuria sp. M1N1S27]|uniref:HEAT repeat domain-containing protein n=1 Tax=Kocuria kalidii TaxID=3376283 RepID=UPI00379185EB